MLLVWEGFWGSATQWLASAWVCMLRTSHNTSLHVASQLIFHLHPLVPDTFCLHWELIFARLMKPSWASRKMKQYKKERKETPGEGEQERERKREREKVCSPWKTSYILRISKCCVQQPFQLIWQQCVGLVTIHGLSIELDDACRVT